MNSRRQRSIPVVTILVVAAIALVLPTRVAAADFPAPLGDEFQVNTYTTARQQVPDIAAGADGGYLLVWESNDGNYLNPGYISGQRYGRDGAVLGSELQINTFTSALFNQPSVAAGPDGTYTVAWQSGSSLLGDQNKSAIHAQRLNPDGSKLGGEFLVNSFTTDYQRTPSVATDDDGDFVIVWSSYGTWGIDYPFSESIQGRRFASSGAAVGGQFEVNAYTTGNQFRPKAAMHGDGSFVVVWETYDFSRDGDGSAIVGQRFTAGASRAGSEFVVNTTATWHQKEPEVAVTPDGGFAVAWYGPEIHARRYDSAGSPIGGDFQVNSHDPSIQQYPDLAVTDSGEFMVVWDSWSSDTISWGFSIRSQLYDSNGTPNGPEYQLNSYTPDDQHRAAVAVLDGREFVVGWDTTIPSGTDVDVRKRQFAVREPVEIYDNGLTDIATSESVFMAANVVADDFVFTTPGPAFAVEIDWARWGDWTKAGQWYIFADGVGQPGALIAQGEVLPEAMSTEYLGEDQGQWWYRSFFLFDAPVDLQLGTTYWFGLHWGVVDDWSGYPVLAAGSTQSHGADLMYSAGGTFDNWTAMTDTDFAFRIYAPSAVFADGFESGGTSAWSAVVP